MDFPRKPSRLVVIRGTELITVQVGPKRCELRVLNDSGTGLRYDRLTLPYGHRWIDSPCLCWRLGDTSRRGLLLSERWLDGSVRQRK